MIHVGHADEAPEFPDAARIALSNQQLRSNVRHATDVIRGKRAAVVGETGDWQELREAGRQIKAHVLRHLAEYLEQFEEQCTRAGGQVHWARDADEANELIVRIIQSHGEKEVIKVKTMTSDETRLNSALEAAGITPFETDLADLIAVRVIALRGLLRGLSGQDQYSRDPHSPASPDSGGASSDR